MDVLCVDKTGTITMNQLTVTGVSPLDKATEAEVLRVGALASQAANQDPIDLAFLAAAKDKKAFEGTPTTKTISPPSLTKAIPVRRTGRQLGRADASSRASVASNDSSASPCVARNRRKLPIHRLLRSRSMLDQIRPHGLGVCR